MVDGERIAVRVCRSARARSYRLTLDTKRGGLRLSMPARASVRKALGWAQGHEAWVRDQMARAPQAIALRSGATFQLEGRDTLIVWDAAAPRRVMRVGDSVIVGGPEDAVGPRVLRWLKAEAKRVLELETREIADRHGLAVASVGLGDPKSRWGSCASSGVIRYSWRLILCPPHVRRATVAHEVAHLLHMDHSPAFHAAHARLLGDDPRPARAWLKMHGGALHHVGL
ncbi:metal-dependent hydrolase [Sphingobium sp. SCG-1]|uniref:M48 family metallopeptidase n=1 Tax=Sphingobium sp. SCG-1 TaxID=2072936 RepID=UPI000CD6C227|nr:SprT family zinc-dependent metalloprotease [Sphingobium sp. SCG-1]AUW60085.1 metal-dependent hydrolase [Sphingobium sp. SCG-1]